MSNENSSGHGEFATIPDEIKYWNWGAFWFSWIWGIANKTYIALLALIPILNIIIPFYLGAKGNELAWRNRNWNTIDEFNSEQRTWSIGGWVLAFLIIISIGINLIKINRAENVTENITNQVLNLISKNEEANKIIGKGYSILFEPALQSVETNQGVFPKGHTIFINGANGIVFVYTSLDEDYSIKEITISPPDNGKKIIIKTTDK